MFSLYDLISSLINLILSSPPSFVPLISAFSSLVNWHGHIAMMVGWLLHKNIALKWGYIFHNVRWWLTRGVSLLLFTNEVHAYHFASSCLTISAKFSETWYMMSFLPMWIYNWVKYMVVMVEGCPWSQVPSTIRMANDIVVTAIVFMTLSIESM